MRHSNSRASDLLTDKLDCCLCFPEVSSSKTLNYYQLQATETKRGGRSGKIRKESHKFSQATLYNVRQLLCKTLSSWVYLTQAQKTRTTAKFVTLYISYQKNACPGYGREMQNKQEKPRTR